jgi:hypothetical protein
VTIAFLNERINTSNFVSVLYCYGIPGRPRVHTRGSIDNVGKRISSTKIELVDKATDIRACWPKEIEWIELVGPRNVALLSQYSIQMFAVFPYACAIDGTQLSIE